MFSNLHFIGAGLPANNGDFYFGNNRPFLSTQPTSSFVPFANVSPDSQNNGFHRGSFDPYSFSDSHCNVLIDQLQSLQRQIIDMYISSIAATNSNQYNDFDLQNTNTSGINLNYHIPNFDSQYHQQNPRSGRCFEQMTNPSQRYNDNHTNFPNDYDQGSEQQNAHQASYFNNERQYIYPQKDSGYRKVTGFSDQYNPSTDHYQAPNFNNSRTDESDYGKGSLSYNSLKEYHREPKLCEERQHNYPNREDQNQHMALNLNRRQHTYPYNHSDYSLKEELERSNQNNPSKDHHQTSYSNGFGSRVKKFFSSMMFSNSQ